MTDRADKRDIITRVQAITDELRVSGGNQDQINASISKLDGVLHDYPDDGLGDELVFESPPPAPEPIPEPEPERPSNAEIIQDLGLAPVPAETEPPVAP